MDASAATVDAAQQMPTSMRSVPVVCAAVLGTFVATGPVSGQDTTGTGSLSGTIRDEVSAPVAFATVCLSKTTTCAVADEHGVFRMPNIRAGTYALEATVP